MFTLLVQLQPTLYQIHPHYPYTSGCTAEDLVPPADAWADFVVLGFRVAGRVEFGLQRHHHQLCYLLASMLMVIRTREAKSEPPNQTAYLGEALVYVLYRSRRGSQTSVSCEK